MEKSMKIADELGIFMRNLLDWTGTDTGKVFLFACGMLILFLGFVGKWKMYEKAGYAGWICLIPFYGRYIWYEMAFGSGGVFLLCFVPILNIIVYIMCGFKMAKVFGGGRSEISALILCRPVATAYLGLKKRYQYVGPYHRMPIR